MYEEDFPERIPKDRRLFILLQQKDGSWKEQKDVPILSSSTSGGMRGDPYYGAFMEEGYLLIKAGWGSSSGTVETKIYEYRNGNFSLSKTVSADDYNYAEGYDVRIQDEQTGTWNRYAIAMDGYCMVRVDLADSEHPEHKAFPYVSIFGMSYYVFHNKADLQIQASEALDRVCAAAAEEAVLEPLPYAEWQKEGYEMLKGVTLPDYYYVLPETKREADGEEAEWDGDYIYYNGLTREDGTLYHVIYLQQEREKRTFLVNDATGEIVDQE